VRTREVGNKRRWEREKVGMREDRNKRSEKERGECERQSEQEGKKREKAIMREGGYGREKVRKRGVGSGEGEN
jgi:hypothetical protein